MWAALSFVGLRENGGGSPTLPDLPISALLILQCAAENVKG